MSSAECSMGLRSFLDNNNNSSNNNDNGNSGNLANGYRRPNGIAAAATVEMSARHYRSDRNANIDAGGTRKIANGWPLSRRGNAYDMRASTSTSHYGAAVSVVHPVHPVHSVNGGGGCHFDGHRETATTSFGASPLIDGFKSAYQVRSRTTKADSCNGNATFSEIHRICNGVDRRPSHPPDSDEDRRDTYATIIKPAVVESTRRAEIISAASAPATSSLAAERDELRRRVLVEEDSDENRDQRGYGDQEDPTAVDAEVSEALFKEFAAAPPTMAAAGGGASSKFHVLSYIANTNAPLYIRRTGAELQVTDMSGYPLMDVWLRRGCFRPIAWVLEAYGTPVIILAADSRPTVFSRRRRRRRGAAKSSESPPAAAEEIRGGTPIDRPASNCRRQPSQTQQPQNSVEQQHKQQIVPNELTHNCCCHNGRSKQQSTVQQHGHPQQFVEQQTEALLSSESKPTNLPHDKNAPPSQALRVCDAANNETLGYFVVDVNPVEPGILIQNADCLPVAKFFTADNGYCDGCQPPKHAPAANSPISAVVAASAGTPGSPANSGYGSSSAGSSSAFIKSPSITNLCVYRCAFVDGAEEEIARLEMSVAQPTLLQLRFTAPARRVGAQNGGASNGGASNGGAPVALTFLLKLLILAAGVRLAAMVSGPAAKLAKTSAVHKAVDPKIVVVERTCCTIV